MRVDSTISFGNWLEANAKSETMRNCYGEEIEIYHIPHAKLSQFMSEYRGALIIRGGVWDAWDCAGLEEGDIVDCVTGPTEFSDGKYYYHMRGSDYDTGIYQPGPSGVIDCECHICFDTATMYCQRGRPGLLRDNKSLVAVFEKD